MNYFFWILESDGRKSMLRWLNSSYCSGQFQQAEKPQSVFPPIMSNYGETLKAVQQAPLKDLWNEKIPNGDFILIKINKWMSCSKMKNEVFMVAILWLQTLWWKLSESEVSQSSSMISNEVSEPLSHARDAAEVIKYPKNEKDDWKLSPA